MMISVPAGNKSTFCHLPGITCAIAGIDKKGKRIARIKADWIFAGFRFIVTTAAEYHETVTVDTRLPLATRSLMLATTPGRNKVTPLEGAQSRKIS
jgi:hypothetical protein